MQMLLKVLPAVSLRQPQQFYKALSYVATQLPEPIKHALDSQQKHHNASHVAGTKRRGAHAFHRQYLANNHNLRFLYEQHNTHDAFKSITTYVLLLLKSRPYNYLSPAAGQVDLQRLGLGAVHFHQQTLLQNMYTCEHNSQSQSN
jgi:hypothetical protein